MADLEGTWTPENETEMNFVMNVNGLAKQAYDDGVSKNDIVSALGFMAASFAMHSADEPSDGPDDDQFLVPQDDDGVEDCPGCGIEIEDVQAFIGGDCIVDPCKCHVEYTKLGDWVEDPTEADDDE